MKFVAWISSTSHGPGEGPLYYLQKYWGRFCNLTFLPHNLLILFIYLFICGYIRPLLLTNTYSPAISSYSLSLSSLSRVLHRRRRNGREFLSLLESVINLFVFANYFFPDFWIAWSFSFLSINFPSLFVYYAVINVLFNQLLFKR